MKIDRLLSLVFTLIDRDTISARELSEKYGVSIRTIQRDMDTLCSAGIPITASQGAAGGYGIIDTYKLNKQLVNTDDLFFILSALESLDASFSDKKISFTIDKIKGLISGNQKQEISALKEKLILDFSALNVDKSNPNLFAQLDEAITKCRLIEFDYTNQKYTPSRRVVEPMTIVFKWYSWYLLGYCRLRKDFRLFRFSRINNIDILPERFNRRVIDFDEFERQGKEQYERDAEIVVLKVSKSLHAENNDYFRHFEMSTDAEGNSIVKMKIPVDDWLYGMILGYGDKIEVVEPPHIRKAVFDRVKSIAKIYEDK